MRATQRTRQRRLRLVLDGRVVDGMVVRVQDHTVWVNAAGVATRWGARLDVGEDVLGWRDPRTGRTVVFRRGVAEAQVEGEAPVPLSAPPDWSDGALVLPIDAVALAAGARASTDVQAGVMFLTRPDPYLVRWRILVDPGHGGRDVGAAYPEGLHEKDLNLDVGRRLARLLKEAGTTVALTRNADTEVSVHERCRRARQLQANLVVSIHHNAYPDSSLQGAEGYYYRRDDGRRLAASLVAALAQGLGVPGRGVREANVGVLSCLECPAALTEAAFVSDPRLARAFHHPWTRIREALALLDGVRSFCHHVDADGVSWGYPSP